MSIQLAYCVSTSEKEQKGDFLGFSGGLKVCFETTVRKRQPQIAHILRILNVLQVLIQLPVQTRQVIEKTVAKTPLLTSNDLAQKKGRKMHIDHMSLVHGLANQFTNEFEHLKVVLDKEGARRWIQLLIGLGHLEQIELRVQKLFDHVQQELLCKTLWR